MQSNGPHGITRYIFDGQNEVGSISQDGTLIDRRVLGIGQGAEVSAAVLVENQGTRYIPLHDLYGNLTALLDDRRELTSTLYDSFGKNDHTSADSTWGYSSKRTDSTGLVFFGRRYYDTNLGRFLTPDPLGLSEGPNLYQYLRNNPHLDFDEYGLSPIITGLHAIDPIKMHAGASMCADISAGAQSLWAWDRSIFNARQQSSYGFYSARIQEMFPLDLSNSKIQSQISLQKKLNYSFLGALVTTYLGAAIFESICINATTTELALSPVQTLPNMTRLEMATSTASQSAALTAGVISLISIKSKVPSKGYPLQKHHFATNKHKFFSPQMESIAQQFGLSLEGSWNTEIMPHLGRHPHDYHEFILFSMQKAAREAKGSTDLFLQLFDKYVKTPIMDNPKLLNKAGWEMQ